MSDDVDVAAILARYERACNELDRMTTAPGGPGASWRWSIPVNPERDSDVLLADSLADLPKVLAELERAQAASEGVDMLIAQAERRGAVKALRSQADAFQKLDGDTADYLSEQAEAIEKGAHL